MSRPDLQNACDSLEARLPGLLEVARDDDTFWGEFGRAAEYIESLAVDREDLAYIRMRVEGMLGKHGLKQV